MKTVCLGLATLFTVMAQTSPLGASGKLQWHLKRVSTPAALLSDGFQAAILHWNNDPREWGQGGLGWSRRMASTTGYDVIRNGFMFGLNTALHQDPRYVPSKFAGKPEVRKRAWHAFNQVFVARTDGGRRVFPFVRLASTYGVAFLSNRWQPDRLSDTRHAVVRGTVTLAADFGMNAFDEFWPDLKKLLHRRKSRQAPPP
ncbi:MAG: hypothetical protein HYR60_33075 [Acidobacteria bacterium]|nr:hypothetical protein [Acidobacteriota bacterium]MBI3470121.1 hypothetical protein [Candidatus Solibacter usitatus]